MPAAQPLATRDLASILLVVVIWGVNFVVMKLGLASLTPFQLGFGRYLFAFLPLALVLRCPSVRLRWLAAFGLTQGLGQFGLLFLALEAGMTAALASVLLQTQVFFSALLAVVLLQEQISTSLKVGMTFALVGLGFFGVSAFRLDPGTAVTGWGLLLTLTAAAMWATSNIIVRLAQHDGARFDPLAFVVWCSAVPIVPFFAMSWMFDPPSARLNWIQAPWTAWAAVAFLGWMATDLGYGLWTRMLKKFPASRVAPFSLGVPLIGLAAGVVVLGEAIGPLQWAGAILVLCALVSVVAGASLQSLIRRSP